MYYGDRGSSGPGRGRSNIIVVCTSRRIFLRDGTVVQKDLSRVAVFANFVFVGW
jgi:hypothetical protein